jgi:hypothetical protein
MGSPPICKVSETTVYIIGANTNFTNLAPLFYRYKLLIPLISAEELLQSENWHASRDSQMTILSIQKVEM